MSGRNGNGRLSRGFAEVCAQHIRRLRRAGSRTNTGLTFEQIARLYTGGRAPGSLARDVKRCLYAIARKLRENDSAILVHPVTAAYFEAEDVEQLIHRATAAMVATEGRSGEEGRTFKTSVAFISSLLPIGRGNAAVGVRIVRDAPGSVDGPLYRWLAVKAARSGGHVKAVVAEVQTAQRGRLLPGGKGRALITEMRRALPAPRGAA